MLLAIISASITKSIYRVCLKCRYFGRHNLVRCQNGRLEYQNRLISRKYNHRKQKIRHLHLAYDNVRLVGSIAIGLLLAAALTLIVYKDFYPHDASWLIVFPATILFTRLTLWVWRQSQKTSEKDRRTW